MLTAGSRPRPSAVLWDLGGVLVEMDWNSASVYWEPRLGLQEGDLLRCLFGGNDDTVLVGRVDEDEWWQVVAQRIGASSREVQALRTDLGRREAFDYELLQVIRDLRGIAKQAVVSNAWGGTRERLRIMEVDQLFDEIVISAEVGIAKPAAKIFQIAWDRLRLSPTDCAFIDDTLENVEAAAALGMHGHLHQSSPAYRGLAPSSLRGSLISPRAHRRPGRSNS